MQLILIDIKQNPDIILRINCHYMTLLQSLDEVSKKPFLCSMNIASQYTDPDTNCAKPTLARLILVAQLIVSLIALPLLLVIGVISFAFRACASEGKEALNELGYVFKEHILVIIPTAAAGIFVSLETTMDVFEVRSDAFARSEDDSAYPTLSKRCYDLRYGRDD